MEELRANKYTRIDRSQENGDLLRICILEELNICIIQHPREVDLSKITRWRISPKDICLKAYEKNLMVELYQAIVMLINH